MTDPRQVFYISDRTGLTAENIGEALLNQEFALFFIPPNLGHHFIFICFVNFTVESDNTVKQFTWDFRNFR